MISPVLFYLTAFVVIFGALMMVAHKNILYSALSMVLLVILAVLTLVQFKVNKGGAVND